MASFDPKQTFSRPDLNGRVVPSVVIDLRAVNQSDRIRTVGGVVPVARTDVYLGVL